METQGCEEGMQSVGGCVGGGKTEDKGIDTSITFMPFFKFYCFEKTLNGLNC